MTIQRRANMAAKNRAERHCIQRGMYSCMYGGDGGDSDSDDLGLILDEHARTGAPSLEAIATRMATNVGRDDKESGTLSQHILQRFRRYQIKHGANWAADQPQETQNARFADRAHMQMRARGNYGRIQAYRDQCRQCGQTLCPDRARHCVCMALTCCGICNKPCFFGFKLFSYSVLAISSVLCCSVSLSMTQRFLRMLLSHAYSTTI